MLLITSVLWSTPAAAQVGGGCSPNGDYVLYPTSTSIESGLYCNSGTWVALAHQVGATSASCSSAIAGTLQWTGSALQYCSGSSWTNIGTAGSSGINLGTSASATNPQRSGDATTGEFSPATGAWAVSSAGTEKIRVTSSGVGIGTTSPAEKLDVVTGGGGHLYVSDYGCGAYGGIGGSNTFTGCTNYALLTFGSDTFINRPSGDVIQFREANATQMTIATGGNVGVGTTSPASQLTVSGAGQTTGSFNTGGSLAGVLEVDDTGSGYGNGGAIVFSADAQTWKFAAIKAFITNSSGANSQGDITFSVRPTLGSGALTEAMRIQASGNVGIGTTSPGAKLQVSAADSSADVLFSGTTMGIRFGTNSGGSSIEGVDSTGYASYQPLLLDGSTLTFAISGAIKGIMNSSGNVGIGTTAPAEPLEIYSSGSGVLLQLASSSGTCNHTPGSSSETVSCTSDMRLKSGVIDTPSELPWLSSVRVRDFTWKSTGQKRTGVIAQELQKTHPEMVTYDKTRDQWTVEQPNPWMLVKLLQEQQAEIDDLKKQLAAKH